MFIQSLSRLTLWRYIRLVCQTFHRRALEWYSWPCLALGRPASYLSLMYTSSPLPQSWFPPLRTVFLLPPQKKETFCPSAHDSGQGVFSGNLPSLHTGDINMKLVVAERGWKWLSAIIYSDIELAQAWSIQSSLRKKKLLDISWSHGRLTFIFKSAWSKSKESRVQHSYRSTGENTKFTLHIVFIPGLPEVSACLQWAHISI